MVAILFVSLAVLLIIGAPIFIGLAGSVTITFALFNDIDLAIIVQRFIAGLNKFSLMAIPLFILAANLMGEGGISRRLINVANAFVGRIPGGLGMTTIIACLFFGAISGSSPATVVAIGGILYPALLEKKYPVGYATGVVTASGALGIIIPPSVNMIVFGVVTGCSVGTLFMAGFGAGVMYAVPFLVYTYFFARRHPEIVREERTTAKEKLISIKEAAWGLGIPFIILGGIYTGVFTPTESAAVAVVYALVIAMFVYKELDLNGVIQCILKSSVTTAQIMVLLAGASVFSWILTSEGITVNIASAVLSASSNPLIILMLINIVLLIAGMFIDGCSMITILGPLFFPIAMQVGIDVIHLGIVMTITSAIGMFTPPFGLNLFVASSVCKQPLMKVAKGCIPFLVLSLIALILLTYIPEISLWLPRRVYGVW